MDQHMAAYLVGAIVLAVVCICGFVMHVDKSAREEEERIAAMAPPPPPPPPEPLTAPMAVTAEHELSEAALMLEAFEAFTNRLPKPLTFGQVLWAVMLGNFLMGLIGAMLWALFGPSTRY